MLLHMAYEFKFLNVSSPLDLHAFDKHSTPYFGLKHPGTSQRPLTGTSHSHSLRSALFFARCHHKTFQMSAILPLRFHISLATAAAIESPATFLADSIKSLLCQIYGFGAGGGIFIPVLNLLVAPAPRPIASSQ